MADRTEVSRGAEQWERLAPLTGIVAVVLWVVGAVLLFGPTDTDDAEEILTAYREDDGRITAGGFIFQLGTLFFIWFLGSLRSRLSWAEGGLARRAAIAFGAGLATAIFLLLLPGPDMAGALSDDDNLSAPMANALSTLTDAFFIAAELVAAVMLLATALVALQTGTLPRWLAWVSLVLALILVIPVIGWAGLLFAFPLWVLAVSVLLWRSSEQPAARQAAAAVP
ncbi:MAG: hypothetical protein M3322_12215 [Actinomycetota bacterium]|nr:hypothetical protein [Actinomycetota bacterium]